MQHEAFQVILNYFQLMVVSHRGVDGLNVQSIVAKDYKRELEVASIQSQDVVESHVIRLL